MHSPFAPVILMLYSLVIATVAGVWVTHRTPSGAAGVAAICGLVVFWVVLDGIR